jgi:hypothetical protein
MGSSEDKNLDSPFLEINPHAKVESSRSLHKNNLNFAGRLINSSILKESKFLDRFFSAA